MLAVHTFLVTAHTNTQISNYTSQKGSHYVVISWFCPAEGTNETGLHRKERTTILQVLWKYRSLLENCPSHFCLETMNSWKSYKSQRRHCQATAVQTETTAWDFRRVHDLYLIVLCDMVLKDRRSYGVAQHKRVGPEKARSRLSS